jgi:uncharacterized OB-fold protein
MRTGTVYTETVVHLAPTRFTADVPYQVAIIELNSGEFSSGDRLTARIEGARVAIGDAVTETEAGTDGSNDSIPFFKKS